MTVKPVNMSLWQLTPYCINSWGMLLQKVMKPQFWFHVHFNVTSCYFSEGKHSHFTPFAKQNILQLLNWFKRWENNPFTMQMSEQISYFILKYSQHSQSNKWLWCTIRPINPQNARSFRTWQTRFQTSINFLKYQPSFKCVSEWHNLALWRWSALVWKTQ